MARLMLRDQARKENSTMKAFQGLLAVVIALVVLAMPMEALAHDHDGWHHDHGNHRGWYKHHRDYDGGGYGYGGYPGNWHHHDDDDDWYEHHGYGGYGYGGYPGYGYGGYPGYGYGYPAPPISVPFSSGYYGSSYTPNMGKMMQLQQTMSQRLNANQALYQAAVAQGNYPLANKVAARMQNQSATLNAANSMLSGAAVPGMSGYPAYNQAAYGNSYYGQTGSPLGSILQMFGY